ncbi:MAG: beta-lactamase family protein [Candidatus Aminicenantes bacterium]|nr:MAG: beta-lactamase family protein [Candidatus Aminicenantes bacterium]
MNKILYKNIIRFLTILTAGALVVSCGYKSESSSEEILKGETGAQLDAKLTPFIEEVMQAYDLPGFAIGIVKDNEVVYSRGFGYKNIETKDPVTTTTLFHMASISKPFVATAIMQLVEQGKIDLEAPVTTYLPYFKLDDERYTDITIQQMLSHVSGMPDVQDYEWDNPQYDEGALERYVRSLADKKMRFDPGKRHAYSNMAFECLGDVIAKVSGMSFADYEKKYILDPAGMKESTFLKPEHLPENWASGHLRTVRTVAWEGYPYNRMHGPSSTLHSNAIEMCNWAIINMKRGSHAGEKILDPASYDLLWKPWFKIGGKDSDNAVGLSWFLGSHRGEKTISHGGGDTGFNTFLILLPEKSSAVIVLCNYIPAPIRYLGEAALDVLLGFEPEDFVPPVSVPVLKALSEKGWEEAVVVWNSLNQEHVEDYNFGQQQFFNMAAMSIILDRIEDGETVIRLLLEILPEEAMKPARGFIVNFLKDNPDNHTAARMLEILDENGS